jgi:secondary thiamine-phosphate synthase enzyme
MASHTEYLWFETRGPREFLNITDRVRAVVRASKVQDGLVLVSAMHITATVYVNDDESGLIHDIEAWADRLAPPGDYQHHRTGESNGDAHLKNLLLGHQVVLPITRGDLDLGPWEQVFYGEFDGQRRKRVVVKVLGE